MKTWIMPTILIAIDLASALVYGCGNSSPKHEQKLKKVEKRY